MAAPASGLTPAFQACEVRDFFQLDSSAQAEIPDFSLSSSSQESPPSSDSAASPDLEEALAAKALIANHSQKRRRDCTEEKEAAPEGPRLKPRKAPTHSLPPMQKKKNALHNGDGKPKPPALPAERDLRPPLDATVFAFMASLPKS